MSSDSKPVLRIKAVSIVFRARGRWLSSTHASALVGAVLFVPLANTPDHLIWFDITPKVATLLFMVGLACVAMPSQLVARAVAPRSCTVIPLGMAVVALLSTAFSQTPCLSLGGSSWRRVGLPAEVALSAFMILQTATACDCLRRTIWCLRASCVGLLLSSLTVVLQSWGMGATIGFDSWQDTVRPGGVLGSGAAFGCYATAPIFLCATLWSLDRKLRWRFLPFIAGTLGLTALLFSGTRGGVVGVLVGALVSIVLTKSSAPGIIGGVSGTLALAVVLALIARAPMLPRLHQVRSDLLGATRLDVWTDSLRLLSNLPTFGYGLESFPRIYPVVQSKQTTTHWPNIFHESAHNYILDNLLSKGVFGLILTLALSVNAVLAYRRMDAAAKYTYAFCIAGHIAGFVSCMFFTPQIPALLYMYLPVSLIWASCANTRSSVSATQRSLQSGPPPLLYGCCTILVRATGLALVAYSICLVLWDSQVYESKALLDGGYTNKAVEAFDQARRLAPPGVAAEIWFSRELIRRADLESPTNLDEQIYQSLRAGVEREEEFGNASVLLAAKMIADGRRNEAGAVLNRTILKFPNWELPKTMLGEMLSSERDVEGKTKLRTPEGKGQEVLGYRR